MKLTGEEQYLNLMNRVINDGVDTYNERTGKNCRTVINADLEYAPDDFPLCTTRKSYWKQAIAEVIGYLRGYSNASQFRKIGCNTWNANANENDAWLHNINRKGKDDLGMAYGSGSYNLEDPDGNIVNTVQELLKNLNQRNDDRGLILSFWNPHLFGHSALRPCMHTHTFSILEDTLHLTSYQRSCDMPLGGNFNMIQVYALLKIMCHIFGYNQGNCYHKIVNAHIYEDQIYLVRKQLSRKPLGSPDLTISDEFGLFELMNHPDPLRFFGITHYNHHEPINYPFSV